jgi:DNA polymerase family A
MSSNSVGLPSSFDRFREVWEHDFEYRQDENHCPVPVALFAKEHRTGTEISMRREQLLASTRLPFGYGTDTLVTSYSNVAELNCLNTLSYPIPPNLLCTYTETSAAINGLDIDGLTEKRPSILEACDLFDIPHVTKEHKARMRDLILNNTEYSEEQWREIEKYNRTDVLEEGAVLEAIAPQIDLPAALFRGRYAKAVSSMELHGLPVDVDYLRELEANWQALRMYYIRRDDTFGLYDDDGSFCEDRLEALIEQRGWTSWPRTQTGKPETKSRTIGKQCKRHPELRQLQRLRDQIAELRLGKFLKSIGADGATRCPILPFWTRSGRNQPSGRDVVYLLSLPSWVHGVIKPPPGWGIAALDWVSQEPGIAAGLSQDPTLITDYQSGDMHMRFAVRAGLAPEWATKRSHRSLRDTMKPVSIGVNYGISKYGVAAQTGKSLQWSADVLASYRHTYPVLIQWQQDVATQALFDERIVSPLGWPMAVHAGTSRRTLFNYLMQAGGADMMRLAAIAAHEAGVRICAPVHDAFWITAPLDELDGAIITMTKIMLRSGRVIAGLEIPVEVTAEVRWPQCLGDVRKPDAKGQALWVEIKDLIRSGALRRTGADRSAVYG